MESRLLTIDLASKYLSIHPQTIYFMARRGDIPFVRIGKRGLRFDRLELDKWIQRKTERSALQFDSIGLRS